MPFGERRMSVWCLSTESEDLSGRVSVKAELERRGSSDNTGRMEKKGAMAGVWADGCADERAASQASSHMYVLLHWILLSCGVLRHVGHVFRMDHSDIQLLVIGLGSL